MLALAARFGLTRTPDADAARVRIVKILAAPQGPPQLAAASEGPVS
jgi:hypothetical protein